MPRIDILIPVSLDQEIETFLNHNGFRSKAEFFRHAAVHYLAYSERMVQARKMGIRLPPSIL